MKTQLAFPMRKFGLIFFATSAFSQTQLYRSDFTYDNFKSDDLKSSISMAGNIIIFNSSDLILKAINKTDYETIWENYVGIRSNTPAYFYKDTFLYATPENQQTRIVQYDMKTGSKIRQFLLRVFLPDPISKIV